MKKLALICILVYCYLVAKAAPGLTNSVYSKTNIDYMFYTNRVNFTNYVVGQSNNTFSASASNTSWTISNLQYLVLSNKVTTNFAVLTPGSNVNWMRITNGIVQGITNAAP